MKLTPEQVSIIRAHVDHSKINIDSLKDDVLDHLCCVVEILMDRGKDFEAAVRQALQELAPEGLDQIQHETMFLLNSTKIILMKKIMYSVGLISSIAISVGFLMKLLQLPGADELITYGLLSFGLLFIPLLAINYFKTTVQGVLSERLRTFFGLASGLIISLGITFKLFHIILADQLLITGMLLFSFGFLPFLFFTMYRKSVS
jgi:hypothetical protein